MALRFHGPAGRENVRARLESLLEDAASELKAAFCFFTAAGGVLFSRHSIRLSRADSYLVVSVDPPTDLEALAELHRLVPDRVYLHLGGVTPVEPSIGRALMHSKVILSGNGTHARLWVGSHNLTASAIEGANFEAALEFDGDTTDAVVAAARAHLDVCRDTAELFDPQRLPFYREVQGSRRAPFGKREEIVVIHAEAHAWPDAAPFTVHVRVFSSDAGVLATDRRVHLYLYQPNSLTGSPRMTAQALWIGRVTGANRTELDRRNPGVLAELPSAQFEIQVSTPVPTFDAPTSGSKEPVTQAVLRLDEPGGPGSLQYSLSGNSPLSPRRLEPGHDVYRSELDRDMARFFTRDSVEGHNLVHRPVGGAFRTLALDMYADSPLPSSEVARDLLEGPARLVIEPAYREVAHPLQPYFFLSRYHYELR